MFRVFLLCWLGVVQLLPAQTLLVSEAGSASPIAGAGVRSITPLFTGTTNAQGQLSIDALRNAEDIVITAAGYQELHSSYTALAAQRFRIYLEPRVYDLDEVVVTASKFAEKRADVAQPIAIIRASDIAWGNQPTSAEVLSNSGQVFVQKSQLGGGSPVLRGFEANKVLIVVDGVPLNNAIFRSGHLQNVLRIDPSMLARTEVVYGPGAVQYGSDAMGGVMHFISRHPVLGSAEKSYVNAGAYIRYASAAQAYTPHLDLNLGFEKVAFLTSITYSRFGDLVTGSVRSNDYPDFGKRPFYAERVNGVDVKQVNADENKQVATGYWQLDLLQKVLFQPSEKTSHMLNLQYSTTGDVPRYDRLTELQANGNPVFAQWAYGPERRLLAAYQLSRKHTTPLYDELRLTAAYQNLEECRINRRFGNVNQRNQIEKVLVYSLNLDANKQLGAHELRYGLALVHNEVNSTAYTRHIDTDARTAWNTRYPDGGSQLSSAAVYVKHNWELDEHWVLTDGLRYTQVRLSSRFVDKTLFPFPFDDVLQNSGALNGQLGIIYKGNAGWRAVALASSAFRAPNVDDIGRVFETVSGSGSNTGTLVVPNPSLKPEYSYNIELTLSKDWGKRVHVESSIYHAWITDLISVQPYTLNGSSQVLYNGFASNVVAQQNAERGRIWGASLLITAEVVKGLRFTHTKTYTYGRQTTAAGNRVPIDHIPPVYGRTTLAYTHKKWQAEGYLQYQWWKVLGEYSPSGEDNLQYATADGMPSWYTANLRVGYTLQPGISIQLAIENVLDVHYRPFASGISGPGRNVVLTLRGQF